MEFEFPYYQNGASNKIPNNSPCCRSKTIFILMCIIPFFVLKISEICALTGIIMLLLENTDTVFIQNYIIGRNVLIHLFYIWMHIPWYSFIVVYVDVLHFFLSWSDLIVKHQDMQKSTLLSQALSFMRLLNEFNEIISPFIFMQMLSFSISILFRSYFWLVGYVISTKSVPTMVN